MSIITDSSGRKLCVEYICDGCGARNLTYDRKPTDGARQANEPVCKDCGEPYLRRSLVGDADTILRDMMTGKQKQVVDLKDEMTRAEVCDEMGITMTTLEGHEERIRKKRREAQQIAERA